MKNLKEKFWTIRIQEDGLFGEYFTFTIGKKHLKIYLVIGAIFALLFISAMALSIFNNIHIKEYNNLAREKEDIILSIKMIESKADSLLSTALLIDTLDKACRIVSKLKDVPDDVREMGVGGPIYQGQIENSIRNSGLGEMVSKVQFKLSKLERKLNFDDSSIAKIKNSLSLRRDVINKTPSILPASGRITSDFGWRSHPILMKKEFHKGIDIANKVKTQVRATGDGIVSLASSGNYFGYGKFIKINHGYGYETRYGHLNSVMVKEGQFVRKGQIIGLMGSTGMSTGSHLHYEVRILGEAVNPVNYILGS